MNTPEDLPASVTEFLRSTTVFRQARDNIHARYGSEVKCELRLANWPDLWNSGSIEVGLKAKQDAQHLEDAVRDYISLTRVPEMVLRGSDYKLAERVLEELGRTLKWKFIGGGVGRHVTLLHSYEE